MSSGEIAFFAMLSPFLAWVLAYDLRNLFFRNTCRISEVPERQLDWFMSKSWEPEPPEWTREEMNDWARDYADPVAAINAYEDFFNSEIDGDELRERLAEADSEERVRAQNAFRRKVESARCRRDGHVWIETMGGSQPTVCGRCGADQEDGMETEPESSYRSASKQEKILAAFRAREAEPAMVDSVR